LRDRRNALAPNSTLPTEIIAAIFFLLRSPGTVASGQPDIHLVLRVAHVCHLWREIALGHPLLWSHVDFTTVSPVGATEILARARMAPLYLEANVPLFRWDDARFLAFQKELQTHISHIHHLKISAEHFRLHTILEGFIISPAPTLEHLSLSVEKWPTRRTSQVPVPDTLFDGTTPRLSSLYLYNCNISWKSPLLKGLKDLTLSVSTRPSLTDWLDTLDEMSQLQRLVLDSASPLTPRLPFDIKRTVTLPFLAHFNISASMLDCGLALAHLVLPALTSLCVTTRSILSTNDMQRTFPYVVQHSHGPHDTRPLQSVFICSERTRIDILASPSPHINVVESVAKLSARVAISVTSKFQSVLDDHVRILNEAIAALPLDNLVTLTLPYNTSLDKQFWRHHAPRWRLLKHVHLAPLPARGFRDMLLQDDGGRECPVLPSLTDLELIDGVLSGRRTLLLCDALMKRVEQGVPLEVLDLRTCYATSVAVQLLGEIVVDVWCPAELETIETEGPMDLTLDGTSGSFVSDDDSGEEYYSLRYNLYGVV
jgi:hypothetical protein